MADSDVGTTNSKFSKAVTTGATMDTGQLVEYDPANGSYPAGTSPGNGKDWGKKASDDADLTKGHASRIDRPETLPV